MGLQKMKNNSKRQRNENIGSPGATPFYPSTATVRMVNTVATGSMESKSTGLLFSTIKTTKMKRTTPKPVQANICLTCTKTGGDGVDKGGLFVIKNSEDSNFADLAKIKTGSTHKALSGGLKGVSLKDIGISFASIFRPTKRMSNNNLASGQNGTPVLINEHKFKKNAAVESTSPNFNNIIIDKNGVFIPHVNGVQISIQKTPGPVNESKSNFTPLQPTGMKKIISMIAPSAPSNHTTPSIHDNKSTSRLLNGKQLIHQLSGEYHDNESNGLIRRAQPSMGVMAFSMKSRRNIRDLEEVSSNSSPKVNQITPKSTTSQNEYINIDAMEQFDCEKTPTMTKNTSEPIYESLNNYQTNELYFALDANNRIDEDREDGLMTKTNLNPKLVPFLDSLGPQRVVNHFAPPVLSSTTRSIDPTVQLLTPHLSLSPVEDESIEMRQDRNPCGKAKKMKSFSHLEHSSDSRSSLNSSVENKEKVFFTYV